MSVSTLGSTPPCNSLNSFCGNNIIGRDKGGGKTRGGGGSITITKTKERKTKDLDEKIIHLRKAIFAENGKDKDILAGIAAAFLKFDRNGLNVDITFSPRLSEDEAEWAFDIVKSNMEEMNQSRSTDDICFHYFIPPLTSFAECVGV